MPAPEPEIEQLVIAIVVLGNFNPMIFHPLWFAQNDLIAEQEVEQAKEVLTSDEVSTFQLNDIHFQIERERFGLTTKDASKAQTVRDLVRGSFSLLEHTPLTVVGLNQDTRFRLASHDAWNAVGDKFAPKPHWKDILDSPGMLGVSMLGTRTDCSADRISIRIAPASGLENGVYVGVNQQYTIQTDKRSTIPDRNKEVMRILNDDWNSFRKYAQSTALTLVSSDTSKEGAGQ